MATHILDSKDEKTLENLGKEKLIKFITKKAILTRRELEKKIMVEKQQTVTVNNYMELIGKESGSYGQKEQRIIDEIDGIDKQIDIKKKQRDEFQNKIDQLNKPRKEAIHEKAKAQGEITKKRLKKIYSYFEKKSDSVPVRIMQMFVGVLINKEPEKISPQDVELYLRRHSGLMIACNKIDAFTINKTLALKFLEELKTLNDEIKQTKYANYVPFYCWVDQQCRIAKISVEIRQV